MGFIQSISIATLVKQLSVQVLYECSGVRTRDEPALSWYNQEH